MSRVSPRASPFPPKSQTSSHIQNPPTVPVITSKHNFLNMVPMRNSPGPSSTLTGSLVVVGLYLSDRWIWGKDLGLLTQIFPLSGPSCLLAQHAQTGQFSPPGACLYTSDWELSLSNPGHSYQHRQPAPKSSVYQSSGWRCDVRWIRASSVGSELRRRKRMLLTPPPLYFNKELYINKKLRRAEWAALPMPSTISLTPGPKG